MAFVVPNDGFAKPHSLFEQWYDLHEAGMIETGEPDVNSCGCPNSSPFPLHP
jgi:hypothetical protein